MGAQGAIALADQEALNLNRRETRFNLFNKRRTRLGRCVVLSTASRTVSTSA